MIKGLSSSLLDGVDKFHDSNLFRELVDENNTDLY